MVYMSIDHEKNVVDLLNIFPGTRNILQAEVSLHMRAEGNQSVLYPVETAVERINVVKEFAALK